MRLKHWAFLILLAVDLIFWFLAFYDPTDWPYWPGPWAGLGFFLALFVFIAAVDILVETIKKRRAYRSFAISITVVSLLLIFPGALLWHIYEWDYAIILVVLGLFMLFLLLIVACALSYVEGKNTDSLWDAIGSIARR